MPILLRDKMKSVFTGNPSKKEFPQIHIKTTILNMINRKALQRLQKLSGLNLGVGI